MKPTPDPQPIIAGDFDHTEAIRAIAQALLDLGLELDKKQDKPKEPKTLTTKAKES
jgi:hypothetical protein